MVLAQIDPNNLAEGLAKNPLAWLLVVALFSIWFLFRELRAEQAARIADAAKANEVIQEVLREVIPLTTKLVGAVELLDRAVDKITEGGAS